MIKLSATENENKNLERCNMKKILIVNGLPRSGKDTFAKIVKENISAKKISSVDYIKTIAVLCGWNGEKNGESRKFLADLKFLTSKYNDLSFNKVTEQIDEFRENNDYELMLIDVREPEEIEKYKNIHNAITVFIDNKRVEGEQSNKADASVKEFKYDYIIDNNSTISRFAHNIRNFLDELKKDDYKKKITNSVNFKSTEDYTKLNGGKTLC